MPTLDKHHSNQFTKMLLMGDPKTGKTGSLVSLVKAGYNLRILDMDNGLETLKLFTRHECPDRITSVEYRTLRDTYKATAEGPVIVGQPKAFVDAIKMLDRWKYDDVDLGVPADWGPDCILAVDTLTFLGDAAYAWADALNPTAKDKRQAYGVAQDAIEKTIALVTSPTFQTNVIVISHVKYLDQPDGTRKGHPTAIGSALSPVIPRYFNSVALCQTSATGKRTLQTRSTSVIDLANPAPFTMEKEYPISTGLADFFSVLRGTQHETKKANEEGVARRDISRPTRKAQAS